jgi:tetraacyldisaccharide 4'-kinase
MNTPRFWQSRNLVSAALLPLSYVYEAGRRLRNAAAKPVTLPVPVLCVGNLTAGGGGKTPVALHIGRWLKARGCQGFFLSRGYGGALRGPLLVDVRRHRACDVGDEPLLLARCLPTVVAKDRLQGAQFALDHGARVIVMDDGLQNPALAKTLSLVVLDGSYGFGNGRLLPAGPLREPAAAGLARAGAIIVINPQENAPQPPGATVLHAQRRLPNAQEFRGRRLVAFCGIAHPEKFFASLAALPATLVETRCFADHYAYTEADLAALVARAKQQQAMLVTTQKDAVRLPDRYRDQVAVAGLELIFEREEALMQLLETAVSTHGKA